MLVITKGPALDLDAPPEFDPMLRKFMACIKAERRKGGEAAVSRAMGLTDLETEELADREEIRKRIVELRDQINERLLAGPATERERCSQ